MDMVSPFDTFGLIASCTQIFFGLRVSCMFYSKVAKKVMFRIVTRVQNIEIYMFGIFVIRIHCWGPKVREGIH